MLKTLPQFKDHIIVRTRDSAILATCDIVVDVGAVYDPSTRRFDHHQASFHHTLNTLLNMDFHTRLSSAGLIYVHYGHEVIANLLKIVEEPRTHPAISILYTKLYKCFVESVDAIDNGVMQYDGVPRYQHASTLASQVGNLNPAWNDQISKPDEQFVKAMEVVGHEFTSRSNYLFNSWLPAREIVVRSLEKRGEVHPSGRIFALEQGGVPWKDHFFTLEKEQGLEGEQICLVIYEDTDKSWRVQSIPISEDSGFNNRIPIAWKGLRDIELEKTSGIEGAIFVHVTGFIGGAKTREGALKLADATLQAQQ